MCNLVMLRYKLVKVILAFDCPGVIFFHGYLAVLARGEVTVDFVQMN